MEIQHTDDGKNGRFFMLADDTEQAFMTYVHAGPGKFIIDHTVVFLVTRVRAWVNNW
ncbi:MAG: hypothetical protein M0D57_02620 [Sphingobacteriales bacterium JAD_PAG50586_3]|nr:MAG: hypothetical protein M0D57_02620 [Sphingobacteriales bacterium JAD_PAG50586_3]